MWPESRTNGGLEAARTGILRWRGCALRDWRAVLIPQLLARVQALSRSSHLGWSARLLRGCTKRALMQWLSSAYKERYQMLFKQYSTEVGVLSSMAEGLRHHLSQFSLQHKTLSENGQGYALIALPSLHHSSLHHPHCCSRGHRGAESRNEEQRVAV